jgi:hypothetical protein
VYFLATHATRSSTLTESSPTGLIGRTVPARSGQQHALTAARSANWPGLSTLTPKELTAWSGVPVAVAEARVAAAAPDAPPVAGADSSPNRHSRTRGSSARVPTYGPLPLRGRPPLQGDPILIDPHGRLCLWTLTCGKWQKLTKMTREPHENDV